MSSLRDRLRKVEQQTGTPEQPKQEVTQAQPIVISNEVPQEPQKDTAKQRLAQQIDNLAEDLDIDKLQELNNGISGYIFNLVMYPVNLLDRLMLILRCNKQKCELFDKTVYIMMIVVLALAGLASYLRTDYFILAGAGIGVIVFLITIRSIKK